MIREDQKLIAHVINDAITVIANFRHYRRELISRLRKVSIEDGVPFFTFAAFRD